MAQPTLPRCVSIGYTTTMSKDAGLRIRIEKPLRERFLALCRRQDRPAAQVIREFMRQYIDSHEQQGRRVRTPAASRTPRRKGVGS